MFTLDKSRGKHDNTNGLMYSISLYGKLKESKPPPAPPLYRRTPSFKMSHRRSSVDGQDMFCREVDIDVCLKTLRICQKAEGDVSCVVWDASLVLVKYLEVLCQDQPELISGTKVLELGAGLGLVGLTAATLGAQVTITDLPEAQSLIRYNIIENRAAVASMGGYAVAETLVWGDLNSDILNLEFEYVLLADCVYYEESVDALIQTLSNLNRKSTKKPIIYLTQEMRDSERQKAIWKSFYSKLEESFTIEKIPQEKQHPDYNSNDINVLKIIKN